MGTHFLEPETRFQAHRRPAAKKPINIQDSFLFGSLKEHRTMAFALIDGKAIQGRILRFDRYAVVVRHGAHETLLYKHAIVAITEVAPEPDDPAPSDP